MAHWGGFDTQQGENFSEKRETILQFRGGNRQKKGEKGENRAFAAFIQQ